MTAIPQKRMAVTLNDGPSSPLPGAMTKEERARAKKRAKKELAAEQLVPSFAFDLRGFHGGRNVEVAGLRDFILSLLIEAREPSWIQTQNKQAISHIVALLVPGITIEALGLEPPTKDVNLPRSVKMAPPKSAANGDAAPPVASSSKIPVVGNLFAHYCPTRAPGDKYRMHSSLQTFTTVPLTAAQKAKRDEEVKAARSKSADLTDYLLTREAMFEGCYPMPSYPINGKPTITAPRAPFTAWQRDDGFIETPQSAGKEGAPKLYGVDCEMVVTEGGRSELARVSVIDSSDQVVYDTLVMPEKPIIDYATQWSGITATRLEGVTTRLADVQKALTELFDFNTVLAGHSLDCDLRVLKFAHPWVIDTSVAYQHTRGPPFKPSLKWLASRWLKREIQIPASKNLGGDEPVGHDSAEDARAAVDLVKLKVESGPGFGEFASDQESIFERIAKYRLPRRTAVVDHGTPAQWHGAKATTAIACQRDDEIVDGIINVLPQHDFVFARMLELSHALSWSQPSSAVLRQAAIAQPVDDPPPDSNGATEPAEFNGTASPLSPEAAQAAAYATLDARLTKLHAALPPRTALVLFTGHADPRPLGALTAKKANFDRLWKARQTLPAEQVEAITTGDQRWTEQDDRDLQVEVDKARQGMAFFCVKKTDPAFAALPPVSI